jgi:Tol biopolymer transport system component
MGPYEILAPIGKGGMGEVYRARDTKLDREVAIKVLPSALARDPGRLARFEREAKVLASLNHPNIAQIYGIEESSAGRALIMELVPGQTLKVPLPLDEALRIAGQIADALEAAHDKGVVHRDLKPANIMITRQGTTKVLDFGLATVTQPYVESAGDPSKSPTLTMWETEAGAIMGTPGYMSPEQAAGLPADKRADIWAYGVVLWEMLTGERLFTGDSAVHILAGVLRAPIDFDKLPNETPRAIRGVVKRCLDRDVKTRLRDIGEARIVLARPRIEEPEEPAPAGAMAPARSGRARLLPWIAAGALLLAFAALATVHFRETPPALRAIQFTVEPPPDANFGSPYGGFAPSPDGRYMVITAKTRGASAQSLWLKPLDSMAARPLPGTEGGNYPTWSPDSRSLAFYADGKLKRIEIAGGASLTLGDVIDSSVSPTGTWNRDGVILFGSAAGLQRVSASGGDATLLTKIDPAKKENAHGYPQFLPDGNRFLYFVDSGDPNVEGVYASSLGKPGQRRQILRTAAKAVYVPPRAAYPGYLLWLQGQTLLAQRFDAGSLRLEGDPVSVTQDIGMGPAGPRASFWASDAGLLTYFASPALEKRPIVWIGRDGKQLEDAAPEDNFNDLALAPGAQRMAVSLGQIGSAKRNVNIWVRDFARGVMTRLTFDPARDLAPVWSPDGKQVAFSSDREGGVFQIFRKDASGAGQEERLSESPNLKIVLDWSRDGKYVLYWEQNAGRRDLMALPLEGDRKPIPVVKTQFSEHAGAISPDGRWVAYASNESGRDEVYVQAFPGAGAGAGPKGQWQVSTDGAADVKWRGDGKELYYESLDGKMMAAAIQAGPQDVRIETPRALFSADFLVGLLLREFDVTPDGQRFLLIPNSRTANGPERLTVVSNWQAALRK